MKKFVALFEKSQNYIEQNVNKKMLLTEITIKTKRLLSFLRINFLKNINYRGIFFAEKALIFDAIPIKIALKKGKIVPFCFSLI